ncbi:hypothetical protein ID866_3472 [Astraeus odoratus]|nr:hypothetical protein ID866_3472 [Astraeus odoratus]
MATMRAVLIKDGQGPVENLYIGETEKPAPKEGQVLVKIVAFGLNRMDLSQREGRYPVPPGASAILGVEFSGHVEQVGLGVSKWSQGDEVFGLAAGVSEAATKYAQVSDGLTVAYQVIVKYGELNEGDDVLVHAGASGVGVAAIQIARTYGARTVTATASSNEKLDWLLSIPNGATHVANYKSEDFSERVNEVTNGKGVDIVVDFVGRTHWEKNINSLAFDGRMILLSFLSGSEVPSVNLTPILYKRLKIQGSTLRSRSLQYQCELVNSVTFQDIVAKITGSEGNGPIRTYIHEVVYPWTNIQEAHKEMAENNNRGKIVCMVS